MKSTNVVLVIDDPVEVEFTPTMVHNTMRKPSESSRAPEKKETAPKSLHIPDSFEHLTQAICPDDLRSICAGLNLLPGAVQEAFAWKHFCDNLDTLSRHEHNGFDLLVQQVNLYPIDSPEWLLCMGKLTDSAKTAEEIAAALEIIRHTGQLDLFPILVIKAVVLESSLLVPEVSR